MIQHTWHLNVETSGYIGSWKTFCMECGEGGASGVLPPFSIQRIGRSGSVETRNALPDTAIAILQGAFRVLEVQRANPGVCSVQPPMRDDNPVDVLGAFGEPPAARVKKP